MSNQNIIKICRIHGPLTIEKVNKNGKDTYKCKVCKKEIARKHYLKNKEKIAAKTKEWRINNIERKRALNRKNWHKNKERYKKLRKMRDVRDKKADPHKFRVIHRNRKRKNRIEMSDGYVRDILTKRGTLPSGFITKELIEIKRVVLAIRRKCFQRKLIGEINEQVK